MAATPHRPLAEVVEELGPLIRRYADESEQERRLAAPIEVGVKAAKLLRTWVPRALGGHEASPRNGMDMLEAVARIDGATAWNLFIWLAFSPFVSFLPDDGIAEVFAEGPDVVGAGGLYPPGAAVVVEGGYRVSGRWPFASGSAHAAWLTGGCHVMEAGRPRLTSAGLPELRTFFMPAAGTETLDTWHVTGLRGTGSNDIRADDLFVPERRSFAFGPETVRGSAFGGALYRFPLYGLIGTPVAVVALGIAEHAIDAFTDLAETKTALSGGSPLREGPASQEDIGKARAAVRSSRAWLYEVVEGAWERTLQGDDPSLQERAELVLASTNATRSAAYAVDLMQSAGGSSAIFEASPIERCFRDVHAVTQHYATSRRNFAGVGRVLLGLPPDNPMVLL